MEVQNLWQTMEKGKMDKQMKIAVVGVGLTGGSFALTLKEKGLAAEVVGVDIRNRTATRRWNSDWSTVSKSYPRQWPGRT